MIKPIKIIGFMVCGAGEADRYLERSLNEFKRLCDDAIIATNNADEKTIKLIKKYGYLHYEDNREWGVHQPAIKTRLLENARQLSPDWILALDSDEVFAPEFDRAAAEALTRTGEIAYHFLVVNLYNDEQHFAHDSGIQRFWNIRFYKYAPELGLVFVKKALHCGLGPPIMYQYGWHAPFYLLHYGLMKKEDRMKKVARYQQYDPKKVYKAGTYYDQLAEDLAMIPFEPEKLLRKLKETKETQPRTLPKAIQSLS